MKVAVPAQGEDVVYTMTSGNIIDGKTGGVALVENGYASQNVDDPATWYIWSHDNVDFKGVK